MTAEPAPWPGVAGWIDEIRKREYAMRCSTPYHQRFERAAVQLTVGRIRACSDADALAKLETILRDARFPGTRWNQLGRTFTRAEFGELIVATQGRRRQLEVGRILPAIKGPRRDPSWIPDDRLEALIQTHRDLAFVDALRAERRRRTEARP